jgi:hypothetical protein
MGIDVYLSEMEHVCRRLNDDGKREKRRCLLRMSAGLCFKSIHRMEIGAVR